MLPPFTAVLTAIPKSSAASCRDTPDATASIHEKCARQQHRISACRYPGKEKQCRKNLLIPKRFVNPFDSNHRASGNPRKGAENGIVKSKRHEDP
jgi:hypothetical protein